jgi:Ca-activated chloride channel family protein
MNDESKSGLLAGGRSIPLEGVRVEARLVAAQVEVTVTQRYRNWEPGPVEAVYVFPLDEAAAVCGFAALAAGKLIRGQVEARERAFEQYDDALLKGDGGFLLDQERPNIFTASVGNLRPGEEVELQIRYVARCAREGSAIRLTIPTTVSPRFVPQGPPEVGEPDGERVNPEHWPTVPYGLTLTVEVAGEGLAQLASPSHPVQTQLRDRGALVSLAQEQVALDRDFVLLVTHREAQRAETQVAREADGQRVAMLTFLPDVSADDEGGREVLFLLDCSGSMGGESIAQARRALALCVRALRMTDSFNVVRFGSRFESLWPAARAFDDGTLEEATRYVERIAADLGGTAILEPLKALLEAEPDPTRERRVLVLTDGQVANEAQILELARVHSAKTRIFSFGIGAGASEYLVRGVARASRGAAEMIFPGERIEPKVMRMFERVRMPVLEAQVDWGGLNVEQAPSRVPPVFAGEPLTIFARIASGNASEVSLIVGDRRFSVPLDLERAELGSPILVLWAREAIRELDDETSPRGSAQRRPEADKRREERLVELGKRYGLLSSATSYVAVEERAPSERTQSAGELRRIPVALTTGWRYEDMHTVSFGALPRSQMSRGGVVPPAAPAPGGAVMGGPASAPAFYKKRRKSSEARGSGAPLPPSAAAPAGAAARPSTGPVSRWLKERFQFGVPAETPSSSSEGPNDLLYELLLSQSAAGSFATSAAFTAWLGAEAAAKLARALVTHNEQVVVTAVVVLLLERREAARESEWRPAANKAKSWLAKQSPHFDANALLD